MNGKLDFWVPRFGTVEKTLVGQAIDGGFVNDGVMTTRLESEVATLLGCKHVVATTSGTAALFLGMAAAGIGCGDEVIVPDATFIATANAVTLTGAVPVLADIDPIRLTIDPDSAERAITARTKAIVPVHVSGRAADMGSILEIARRHGLFVIEDAAEAFLSRYQGRCLGTFGIAGCFSLSPNKTITTGQGGLIATDDDALHLRLRELKDQGRRLRGTGGDDVHDVVGYNFKFTDLQAAVGLGQLADIDHRVERMKNTYRGYVVGLQGLRGVSVMPFCVERGECPQWTDALFDRREGLYRHLEGLRIQCRRFWRPLHSQSPYRLPDNRFPNSTRQLPRAMWLPSALTLTDEDVGTVCDAIRNYLA